MPHLERIIWPIFVIFVGLQRSTCNGGPLIANRVVNGSDALYAEFPYMASLRTRTGMHTCGATILATDWILTAAHCIYSENPEDYSVQYGTNEISRNGDYIVKVKKIVVHQGYDGDNNFIHDIAVLQLEEPIEFNKNVHPVQIPEYLELTEGGVGAMVVGWGYNDTAGMLQNWLQKVELETVTDSECRKLHFERIHSTNICAGVVEGGKGQCTGDSGGPLLVNNKQVGIVSWSMKPCTAAPYPGVFTEISYYTEWLREHTDLSFRY